MNPESTRLTVLVLTSAMTAGGPQRFIATLLKEFDRSAFDFELAMMSGSEIEFDLPDDVRVYALDDHPEFAEKYGQVLSAGGVQALGAAAGWVEPALQRIAGLVRHSKPDVVLCAPEQVTAFAAAAASTFPAATRLVGRIGAPPSIAFDEEAYAVPAALAASYFDRVDRFWCNSASIARDLESNFRVVGERVRVIRNPVDLDRIADLAREPVTEIDFDAGVPTIVFVGRLDRVKGLEYLLQAVARVNEQRVVRCVLVGDGAQRGFLRALVKHLGIDDAVTFAGAQRNPYRFLSKATAFVLPSLSEGMPNVLLEAMACGCPVIATDIEGGVVREILEDGTCGIIVPRADTGALAEAIERVLDDDRLREGLVAAGLDRIAHFSQADVLRETESALAEAAGVPVAAHESGAADPRASDPGTVPAACPPTGLTEAEAPTSVADATDAPAGSRGGPGAVVGERVRRVIGKALGALSRRVSRQGASPVVFARSPGKRLMLVVASGLENALVRVNTEALLGNADRGIYDVALCAVFDELALIVDRPDIERHVLRADATLRPAAIVPPGVRARYAGDVEWLSAVAGGLARTAAASQADIVLAQGVTAASVLAMAASELPERTVSAAWLHDDTLLPDVHSTHCELQREVFAANACAIDAVFVSDEDAANRLSAGESVPRCIGVLTAPVTPDDVGAPSATPGARPQGRSLTAVTLATDDTAALTTFLEAVARARTRADIRGIVFGAVAQAHADAVEASGLGDAVKVRAGIDGLAESLSTALAYVHPASQLEAEVPSAVIVAVAAGCPVVTRRGSDTLFEFLGEGERGIILATSDPDELAEAMLALAWDEDAAQALAEKAFAHLETVSGPAVIRRLEMLVESCRASGDDLGVSGS